MDRVEISHDGLLKQVLYACKLSLTYANWVKSYKRLNLLQWYTLAVFVCALYKAAATRELRPFLGPP